MTRAAVVPVASLALALLLSSSGCSDAPGGGGHLYYSTGSDGELWLLDLATGDDRKLGIGNEPDVAPDGRLVFTDGNNLVESDTTLVEHRVIVKFDTDIERSNNGFHEMQVSPDGTRVAYRTNDDLVYVASRADGQIVARFEDVGGVTGGLYRPTWTPDGRLVVAGGFGNPGLFLSDAGLTTLVRFDGNLAQPKSPCVSPDGTRVAFVLNQQIYVIGLDGSGLRKLSSDNDEDTWPTWSPDGTQIAYDSKAHLLFQPAGGGAVVDLFTLYPAFADTHLIWSSNDQFTWVK